MKPRKVRNKLIYEIEVQRVQYDRARQDLDRQTELLHRKIVRALLAGEARLAVIAASKYTEARVRSLAREAGIKPLQRRGPFPRKKENLLDGD
jgi:hypothetical protein